MSGYDQAHATAAQAAGEAWWENVVLLAGIGVVVVVVYLVLITLIERADRRRGGDQ